MFLIGAALIEANHRLRPSTSNDRNADWVKYGIYVILVYGIIMLAFIERTMIALFVVGISAMGMVEFHRNMKHHPSKTALSLCLFGIALICLGHLLIGDNARWRWGFAFTFLIVSVADSFSQLWGRLLGSRKLCPRISPGKTVEGLFGGLASSVLAAIALRFLIPGVSLGATVLFGAIIAIAAIIGDLTFSLIKRKIAIKDFSNLLPGHGGILDRFDSLIVAAPVSYWAGVLIIH
jgi:phosphatidate cytidylyltransferase